jgi:hypothetical protein
MWFLSSMILDLAIAFGLLFCFWNLSSDYSFSSIRFSRLAVRAVASGSVTALYSALVYMAYRLQPIPSMCTGSGIAMPQVYGITLLMALNYRHSDAAVQGSSAGPSLPINEIRLDQIRSLERHGATQQGQRKEPDYWGSRMDTDGMA